MASPAAEILPLFFPAILLLGKNVAASPASPVLPLRHPPHRHRGCQRPGPRRRPPYGSRRVLLLVPRVAAPERRHRPSQDGPGEPLQERVDVGGDNGRGVHDAPGRQDGAFEGRCRQRERERTSWRREAREGDRRRDRWRRSAPQLAPSLEPLSTLQPLPDLAFSSQRR